MTSSDAQLPRRNERYGKGTHAIADGDPSLLFGDELLQVVLRTFHSPEYVPPALPAVAMELMQLTNGGDPDIQAVEELLGRDPMLAARILKIASSRVHNPSGTMVESVKSAIVRLGAQTLRDIVFQIAMTTRVFRAQSFTDVMEALRAHSIVTAHLARIVARYAPIDGGYAFLCGLLHDVGLAAILIAISEKYSQVRAHDLSTLWSNIDEAHATVSGRLAELWELPMDIRIVLQGHHTPSVHGAVHPLAAVICLANRLAEGLRPTLVPALFAEKPFDETELHHLETSRESLGISDSMYASLRKDAEACVETLDISV